MKQPKHTSLHEIGADARIARIFRWSAIAAAVLTLIVALGLLAWWWLSRDTPVSVDEIALLPPEPLTRPGVEAPPALRFTDITAWAGIDFTHVNGAFGQRLLPETIGASGGRGRIHCAGSGPAGPGPDGGRTGGPGPQW